MERHRKWKNSGFKLTFNSWRAMVARCTNTDHKDYHNYGGRGIKICSQWINDFDVFFEDMGEKPKGLSIDRINNNGDYEPYNCRWADAKQQARNKQNSRLITLNGITKNLSAWAEENDMTSHVLRYRIQAGMKPNQLFSKEKVKPKDYRHLKNLSRKDNVIIEFDNQKLTIAQWAEKTGLRSDTIWHRIYDSKWPIQKALTVPASTWNHGTNTGYSKYKCRCIQCTEFNRLKSQRARDRLKLKQGE